MILPYPPDNPLISQWPQQVRSGQAQISKERSNPSDFHFIQCLSFRNLVLGLDDPTQSGKEKGFSLFVSAQQEKATVGLP